MENQNNEKTVKKEVTRKDYRLMVSTWWSERNGDLQFPVKVYEVREKAIKALLFEKSEDNTPDKPFFKWIPVSQVSVKGDFSKLEKLVDVINHYSKCEIKYDFINENKELEKVVNDFEIVKASDKALFLKRDNVSKWVPKSCVIVTTPLLLIKDKLDLINKLGYID